MRIVLTHPYCWPYVRRGAERFIAELARYLSGRGHEVITVSSKPGSPAVETSRDGKRILRRQLWHPAMSKIRLQPTHLFFFSSLLALARLKADVIHSAFYTDAWAATLLQPWRRYATVYQVTGPPVPTHFPRVPPDRWVLRQAIRAADCRLVHSEFTRGIVSAHYGIDAEVIPVPVDLDAFPLRNGERPRRPTILCVASFDERRKGLLVLVKAFELVKKAVPSAVLQCSGQMSAGVQAEALATVPDAVRSDIAVLGVGALQDVSRLYRNASVTVLPSMWEAYGMVVIESWASGTPVVVTNHGGLPELVRDSSVGLMFEPQTAGFETTNAAGLAEAILAGLALAERPETRERCRARAEHYSWPVVGPAYEQLYSRVREGGR